MKKNFKPSEIDKEHEDLLTLSLSTPHSQHMHSNSSQPPPLLASTPPPQRLPLFSAVPQPPPPPPPFDFHLYNLPHNPPASHHDLPGPSRPTRTRRSPAQTLGQGKTETIPAPYPWATTKRATVHNLDYLQSNHVNTITGLLQCKKCDQSFEISYNFPEKFLEVAKFVLEHKSAMRDRAPKFWTEPTLPDCNHCHQIKCMKPVISKKRSINWLFLLLGQMLGCCKLSELKYFCKHTKNHRTGAKDRVLYLTYLGICKQVDPSGPFDAQRTL
ncbi:hypothetical protein ACE6H2_021429 [Prunus campanulata]